VTLSTSSPSTTVSLSSSLPNTSYTVELTITSSTNFTSSSGWGYLQATTKATGSFVITLHNSDASTKNAPANTTVDWVAIPNV
jgi:hypothetical protein